MRSIFEIRNTHCLLFEQEQKTPENVSITPEMCSQLSTVFAANNSEFDAEVLCLVLAVKH